MSERLNVKNLILEPEPQLVPLTIESVRTSLELFLLETFKKRWNYTAEQMKVAQANLKPEIILPQDIDYAAKKADRVFEKSGEYTLNPSTATINWERVDPSKLKFEKPPETLTNKPLAEVVKYIIDTYGTTHYLPGLEYWQYILQNPEKMPPRMKAKSQSGNTYFTFGSLVRGQDGIWRVPYAQWGQYSQWARNAGGLDGDWHGDSRIVLLEKTAIPKTFAHDSTPPQPKYRNF